MERGRRPGWAPVLALIPLLLSAVWLPLRSGGSDKDALASAQIAAFAAVAVLAVAGRLRGSRGPLKRAGMSIGVLVAAAATATAFSLDLSTSVPALLVWAWLGASALLFFTVATDPRLLRVLGGALAAALLAQLGVSFFSWWGGGSSGPLQSGTFFAPNQYAGYVALLAPVLLAMALTRPPRPEAAAWGAMAVLAGLGIAFSGSRAGLGAAAVGAAAVVALCVPARPRRVGVRAGLVAAGFVAGGLFMTSPLIFSDEPADEGGALSGIGTKAGTQGASFTLRMQWAQGALRIAAADPLTGSGPGTYGDRLFQIQEPEWQWSRYAHNQYLEALAEGGILLFLGTLVLPIAALSAGFRPARAAGSPDQPWAAGLWGGLLAGSAHLTLDHDWSFPAYAFAYVAVALILSSYGHSARAREEGQEGRAARPWRRRGVLAAAALAALVGAAASTGGIAMRREMAAGGEEAWERAIRLAPYASLPRRLLAESLLERGETEAALARLEAAARLNRLDAGLRLQLGQVHTRLRTLDAAERAYREAIEIAPLSAQPYAATAAFLDDHLGSPREAKRILDSGLSVLRGRPATDRIMLQVRAMEQQRRSLGNDPDSRTC